MKKFTVIIALFIAVAFMPGQVDAATKPGKIKTITAEKTTSSVTLKWSKAKKAKKYSIYKNGRKIKVQKARKYTASRLKANTVYRFKVQAVNGAKKGKAKTITVRTKAEKTATVTKKPTTTNETNSNWDYTNGPSVSYNDNTEETQQTQQTTQQTTQQVENINFDKSSISMVVGDYETLYLKYNPTNAEGKNATFEVFNKNVAKVQSSGTTSVSIKAVKAGKTTIEAKCNGKTTRCSIVVKEEEQDGLKYTYDVYKLKNHTIHGYTERGFSNEMLIVVTDNPLDNKKTEGFYLYDETNKKAVIPTDFGVVFTGGRGDVTIEALSTPSNAKSKLFKDINIPDKINGKNVYLFNAGFKEGNNEYKMVEYDSNKETGKSSNSIKINVKSYEEDYNNWLDSEYEEFKNLDISVPKKMAKFTKKLKDSAIYWTDGENSPNYYHGYGSLKMTYSPKWETKCWDSAYLKPMKDYGKKLGFTNIRESRHAVITMDFNNESYSYVICPDSSTSKLLSDYCPMLTMNDYEKIASYN